MKLTSDQNIGAYPSSTGKSQITPNKTLPKSGKINFISH